jgi:hypothetical protein
MNNITLVRQIIAFFIYWLIQVLFVKNLEVWNIAFCFVYISFILFLPITINHLLLMGLSFLMGFLVDIFYDTLGIQSAACVAIAYLRPYLLTLLTDKNELFEISIRQNGLGWFVRYTFTLTFIHHLLIFFIQQFNFKLLGDTILKVLASTLFTGIVIVILQYLFYSSAISDARK